jgi:hypothetical protein
MQPTFSALNLEINFDPPALGVFTRKFNVAMQGCDQTRANRAFRLIAFSIAISEGSYATDAELQTHVRRYQIR